MDGIAADPAFLFDDAVQDFFGDLPRALLTLFQLQTMDDWVAAVWMVKKREPLVSLFFLVVLAFSFLINSVVTAVMIETWLTSAATSVFSQQVPGWGPRRVDPEAPTHFLC